MSGKKKGVVRTNSLTYKSYTSMISRCYVKKYKNYHLWGGRGITVCDRWLGNEGYHNFCSDMGLRIDKTYSLNRLDNDGNYEPDNCRWATKTQQARNRSTNVSVMYFGKKYVIAELAEYLGIKYGTLRYRIKNNMPQEKWGSQNNFNYKTQVKLRDFNANLWSGEQ